MAYYEGTARSLEYYHSWKQPGEALGGPLMANLDAVLMHIMSSAGRSLGRTQIVKLTYLVDVESTLLTGTAMTSACFLRYYYGPYASEVVGELEGLVQKGMACRQEIPLLNGFMFTYSSVLLGEAPITEPERAIIESIVVRYKDMDLNSLKGAAYNTAPMRAILKEEQQLGIRLDGRPLDMSKTLADRSKRPLSAILKAKDRLDVSSRGTVEQLAGYDLELFKETEPFRRRASQCLSDSSFEPRSGQPGTTNKGKST